MKLDKKLSAKKRNNIGLITGMRMLNVDRSWSVMVSEDGGRYYYSYLTPVAYTLPNAPVGCEDLPIYADAGKTFATEEKFSRTTTKHIRTRLAVNEYVSQERINFMFEHMGLNTSPRNTSDFIKG